MNVTLMTIGLGHAVVLKKLPAVIGRDAEADVRLDDPEVRPFHCMLGDGQGPSLVMWAIRTDARILLNGHPVTRADVLPGDQLTVGSTQFRVDYAVPSRQSPQRQSA